MKMLKKTNKLLCLLFASSIIATSVPTQSLQAQEVKTEQTSTHMTDATREKYMAGEPVPVKDLFPDPVLAKAARNVLSKQYDDQDATTTKSEIEEVTHFGVEGEFSGPYEGQLNGLRSLAGLELFSNVTSLYIVQSYVTDLSPIMELKQLENLTLYYLYGLDFSAFANASLPNLRYLTISDVEGITDISPLKSANLPNLEQAHIYMKDIKRDIVKHGAKTRLPNMFKDLNGEYIKPEINDDFDYEDDQFVLTPNFYYEGDYDGRMYEREISVREYVPFGQGTLDVSLKKIINVTDGSYPVKFLNNENLHEHDYWNPLTVAAGSLIPDPGAAAWNEWDFRYGASEFLGWYTVDGHKWDFAHDTMPEESLVLYARYRIVATYSVVFYGDSGLIKEILTHGGEVLTPPADPIKEGHRFIGWYLDWEGGDAWNFERDRAPEKDLFFTPRFAKLNKVSYHVDGEVLDEVEVIPGQAIDKPADPVKPGYRFTGWYPQERGGKKWVFKRDTAPEDDLQLYARFEENETYTVSFHADGVVTERELNPGQLIAKPADPVKPGYRFAGWYVAGRGGNKWVFKRDIAPESNLQLHALFVQNPTYTVSYNVDGVVKEVALTPGQLIEKPADPVKEGYRFTGWYTQERGGNKWVFNRNKAPEKNVKLYARFK